MMYPKKYFRFLTKRNAVVAFIALASAFWICGIATALMVGGDPPPPAQAAQAGIPQIVITQNLAAPTYTPYPTYTAPAQPQAQTILVAATSPPDFTQLHIFEGNGKGTTDLFSLPTGIIRIKWEYIGESNFAFSLKRLDNEAEEMLENAIGSTSGQYIMNVGASDQYLFDFLFADGNWKVTVEYRP